MKNWTKNYIEHFRGSLKAVEGFVKTGLIFTVGIYRTIGTQFFGGQCRFHPSCSHYALEALQIHPIPSALQLITKRILKCHPFGSSGWDPVPARKENLDARQQSATQAI
jgi:uncharacterized protein